MWFYDWISRYQTRNIRLFDDLRNLAFKIKRARPTAKRIYLVPSKSTDNYGSNGKAKYDAHFSLGSMMVWKIVVLRLDRISRSSDHFQHIFISKSAIWFLSRSWLTLTFLLLHFPFRQGHRPSVAGHLINDRHMWSHLWNRITYWCDTENEWEKMNGDWSPYTALDFFVWTQNLIGFQPKSQKFLISTRVILWPTNHVSTVKYSFDHIRLKYSTSTFDCSLQAVEDTFSARNVFGGSIFGKLTGWSCLRFTKWFPWAVCRRCRIRSNDATEKPKSIEIFCRSASGGEFHKLDDDDHVSHRISIVKLQNTDQAFAPNVLQLGKPS